MKAILRATCDWLLILAFAAAWALFVAYLILFRKGPRPHQCCLSPVTNKQTRTDAPTFMNDESLDQLAATVPDLLIQDCAGCGEHLASRLQGDKLLERSGLRVIAGKKPCEVRGHDRPYCHECLWK